MKKEAVISNIYTWKTGKEIKHEITLEIVVTNKELEKLDLDDNCINIEVEVDDDD